MTTELPLLFTLESEGSPLVCARKALAKWEADLEQAQANHNTLYIEDCVAAIEFWSRRVAELERELMARRVSL